MKIRRISEGCILAIVFLVLTTACGAGQSPTQVAISVPTSTANASSESVSTEGLLPANCSRLQITQLIANFTATYNAGSFDQIEQYLDLDRFEYFVGGHKADQPFQEILTSNRTELLAYFSQRHAAHEEIYLLKTLDMSSDTSRANSALVLFDLSRRADDFPEVQATVKGIVDCKAGKFYRWIWYGFDLP